MTCRVQCDAAETLFSALNAASARLGAQRSLEDAVRNLQKLRREVRDTAREIQDVEAELARERAGGAGVVTAREELAEADAKPRLVEAQFRLIATGAKLNENFGQSADLLNRLGGAAGLSSGDMAALCGNYLLFARDAFLANQELARSFGSVGQEVDRVTKKIEPRSRRARRPVVSVGHRFYRRCRIRRAGHGAGARRRGHHARRRCGPDARRRPASGRGERDPATRGGGLLPQRRPPVRRRRSPRSDPPCRTPPRRSSSTFRRRRLARAEDIAEEIAWKLRTVG